jgi:hypothetical protein
MSFFMLLLVTQIDKTWILAGLPARFLLSVIGFSCAIVVVRMTDVRPMIWWKRQLLYYGKPIPVRLPDVHWSNKPDSPATLLLNNNSRVCLKVRKEEFEALEEDKKQKILDSLVEFIEALDFTPGRSEDLQMLCSPMYSSPTMEDVDIYFVTSGELKHEMLKNKLLKAGLNVETVSQEATRSLLYGFLSPSHYEADEPIPPTVTHINDLVTLCSGGLDQQRQHVVADGRYIRSLYVKLLPRTTFFGILNRLLELNCKLSLSVYFGSCDQTETRRQLSTRYKLLTTTNRQAVESMAPETTNEIRTMLIGERSAIDVGLYVTVYGDSAESARNDTVKVEKLFERLGGTLQRADSMELDALVTALPLGRDELRFRHRVSSQVAATLFPFT